MLGHDVKVAWRNLLKYKRQTVISILGLAVGLTSFVVCNNNLRDELMWDRRLPGIEDTYVLVTSNSDYEVYPSVQAELARKMQQEIPEIARMTIYYDLGGYTDKICVVEQEDGFKTWRQEAFLYTDSSFMDFFDFRIVHGNWEKVKGQPDAVILTLAAAKRIFGTTDVVGRTFMDVDDFDNTEYPYRVAAVMENFPEQTSFESKGGLVLNPVDKRTKSGGYHNNADVLLQLRPGINPEGVNGKIAVWWEGHPELKNKRNVPQKLCPYLEIRDYILDFHWTFPLIFTGVGLLVLLTAVFNYILFLVGRMLNRQKEYAIREICGATPKVVFRMFAIEISLSIGMAVFVALIFLELLPVFMTEEISNYMYFDDQHNWITRLGIDLLEYSVVLWGMMLFVCRLIMRRIQSVSSLRNLQVGVPRKVRVRNILLGLQLMICVFLGGAAYFMYAQYQYLQEKVMGKLSSEECRRIYEFPLNGNKLEPIRKDFQNMVDANPYIEMACRSGNSLLKPWTVSDSWHLDGLETKGDIRLHSMYIDPNYPEFVQVRMEEGRFFRNGEHRAAVVNREFVRCWGVNPLGKEISFEDWGGTARFHIVGIIEDILPNDRNPQVVPCVYFPFEEDGNWTYYIKLRPKTDPGVLEPLRLKMQEQVNVFTPLWIERFDEQIAWGFDNLKEIGFLTGLLALVCVLISLLGIYSSMMLAVEKRSKEMVIRKINGATLADIARIFVRHYLYLGGLAVSVAFPVLIWGVGVWLENYSYRIEMTLWPFVIIFMILLLVILLTIGSQLLKIIRINPADTMKRE